MAAPTVTQTPAPPVVTLALPAAVPGWPFGAGTFYFRWIELDTVRNIPPLMHASIGSVEVSITLAAGQSPFFQLTCTPNAYAVLLATTTPGSYGGATLIVNADGTTPFKAGGTGLISTIVTDATLINVLKDLDPDVGIKNVVITGGAAGDPIRLADAAADPVMAGLVERPPDGAFVGRNPGPMIWPAGVQIGDGATATTLRLDDGETAAFRGGLRAKSGAALTTILAGSKTVDGARVDGPTLVVLGVDPDKDLTAGLLALSGHHELYAGALIDASQGLAAPAAGTPNPWVGADLAAAKSIGIQLQEVDPDGTSMIESWRFDGWPDAKITVTGGGSGSWTVQDVGAHDCGSLSALAPTVQGFRLEDVDSGIALERSTTALRSVRVVSRIASDIVLPGIPTITVRIVDSEFPLAAADDDPVVTVPNEVAFILGGKVTIERSVLLEITDALGAPVAGATVRAVSAAGVELFSQVTDGNGLIASQDVVRDTYAAGATPFPVGATTGALSALVAAGYLAKATNTPVRLEVTVPGTGVYSVLNDLDRAIVGVIRVPLMPGVLEGILQPEQLDGVLGPVELVGIFDEAAA